MPRPRKSSVHFSKLCDVRLRLTELEARNAPAIFTVTNVNDTGAGSFRQAILDANAAPGADTIRFAIGTGAKSIAPASPLPTVTDTTTIDATTQPGYAGTPLIELRGDGAGLLADGLSIAASNSVVSGFVINRFDRIGIYLSGPNNTVRSNWIGVDASGTAKAPNFDGVYVESSATGAVIGGLTGTAGNPAPGTGPGNVISGNTDVGVYLLAPATIQGNLIGLAPDGSTTFGAPSTNGIGVYAYSGADNVLVGGTDVRARNVISGTGAAFNVYDQTGWQILNNYIGTDRTGTLQRTNFSSYFTGTKNLTIGRPGAGNVWVNEGYYTTYSYGDNWTVQGNRFGTTADGSTSLISDGNASGLVFIQGSNLTFGGTNPGEGNQFSAGLDLQNIKGGSILGNTFGLNLAGTGLLSGTAYGVVLDNSGQFQIGDGTTAGRNYFVTATGYNAGVQIVGQTSTGNILRGNWFGLNRAGTATLGNLNQAISVTSSAANNLIDGNVIAKAGTGITVDGTGTPDFTAAWFKGDGNLTNSSGYQVDGTIVGAGISYGTGLNGFQALSFTGSAGGHVYSEHIASYTTSADNLGLGAWINPASLLPVGKIAVIAANGLANAPNYLFGLIGTPTGNRLFFQYKTVANTAGPSVTDTTIGGAIPVGSFTYVAVSGSSAGFQFYVNGIARGNLVPFVSPPIDDYVGVAGDPTMRLYIGGLPGGITTFDGLLQDVTMSYPGYSAGQIARIYSFGGGTLGGSWTRNTTITGNIIGLLPDGTTVGSVTIDAIAINNSETNTIGGTTAASRNILSGNGRYGINIFGSLSNSNVISGNYVGTDVTGTLARGNIDNGIFVDAGALNTRIGGTTAASRNIISGNIGDGVTVSASPTTVIQGNYIGVDRTGLVKLANVGNGIQTDAAIQIGGLTLTPGTGAGNVISGNGSAGSNGNIRLNGAVASATIQGNIIGLDAVGNNAVDPVTSYGVWGFLANGITIGGSNPQARNVIAGHGGWGLLMQTVSGVTITGNYIGTDITGTKARGNGSASIALEGTNNTVGDGTTAGRNIISGNTGGDGIWVVSPGTTGNTIRGNYIGTDPTGRVAVPNVTGIFLWGLSSGNTIGGLGLGDGNVISGNAVGVQFNDSDTNAFLGNTVGLASDRLAALPNTQDGVLLTGSSSGNVIGGGASSAANYIAANGQYGIETNTTATSNSILGNVIGLNAASLARGNGLAGIFNDGSGPLNIGGTGVGEGNVIAANPIGVRLTGSSGNTLLGNFIGTNRAGLAGIGNIDGIIIEAGSQNNTVGGPTLPERNIISGNTKTGVTLTDATTSGNRIIGNLLGSDATLSRPLPNSTGILVTAGATSNAIGGTLTDSDPALGNLVTTNTKGILLDATAGSGNSVRLNRTYSNSGGNLLNQSGTPAAPTLNLAVANAATTRVRGTITGAPNAAATIDFYEANLNESAARRYLGTAIVTLGPTGTATYDLTLPVTTSPGAAVTAIVTTAAAGSSGFGGPQGVLAPINITVSAPQLAPEGTEITVTSRVSSDRLDAIFRFDWSVTKVGTPGIYARGSDASLVFTPDDNAIYRITLTVTDTTNNESVTFAVPDLVVTNVVPIVRVTDRDTGAEPTSTSLAVGGTLRLQATATDPGPADQPTLTYRWFVNGTAAGTGPTFNFTPSTAGTYLVGVRVTDKDGGESGRAISVSVQGSLAAAVVVSQQTGTEGLPVTASVQINGAIDNSRLRYNWQVTKNGTLYYSAASVGAQQLPQVTFTPNDNGLYLVTLTVTDPVSGQTASASTTVTVANVAPTVTARRTTTVTPTLGTPLPFTAVVTDPGTNATNNDLVQVTWTVIGPQGFVAPAPFTGTSYSFTPTVPGGYFIKASASDKDGGLATDTQTLTVTTGTRSVNLTGVPASAIEGQSIPLTASATAAGVSFTYTWVITRNGDPFATGSGSAYTFIPGRSGSYAVVVTARGSDGSIGIARASLTVSNAPPLADIAPTPTTVTEGTTVTFTSRSKDPGGPDVPLTLGWTVTGPGLPLAGQTSTGTTFRFTAPNDGTYTVTLSAADPSGAKTTATRTLIATNVAPTVRVVNNGTGGGVIRVKANASDPSPADTLALTYQWYVNGVLQPGATTATFSTTSAGLISVAVRDNLATTTAVADVRVMTAPGKYVVAPPAATASQILVIGTSGNDEIDATALSIPVVLDGGDGNDTLRGGSGDDVLVAGPGTNKLYGNEGNNRYIGGGNDTMVDGSGNGYFEVHFSTVSLDAGPGGVETIDLSAVPFGITLDLNNNTGLPQPVNPQNSSTLALTGTFENLIGTAQADTLTAAAYTTVTGGGGADRLTATGAGATLLGGADPGVVLAADPGAVGAILIGGDVSTAFNIRASDVTLLGGTKDDSITLTSDAIRSVVDAGGGGDNITLTGADFSTLIGGAGDDIMNVSGNNLLIISGDGTAAAQATSAGADRITISGNSVTLLGGDGADFVVFTAGTGGIVSGGDGVNTLIQLGGTGLTIQGGIDSDTMVLRSGDASTLLGGDGADTVFVTGGTGAVVSGGIGNDVFTLVGSLSSTLLGGTGDDVIRINPLGGVTVPNADGSNSTVVPTIVGPIYTDGGDGQDLIRIEGGDFSTLLGGVGDDTFVLTGGTGLIVSGGDDRDILVAAGGGAKSTLLGGAGDDLLIGNLSAPLTLTTPTGPTLIAPGSANGTTLLGGAGSDTLVIAGGNGLVASGGDDSDRLVIVAGVGSTLLGGTGDDSYVVGAPFAPPNSTTLPAGSPQGTFIFAGDGKNTFLVSGGSASTLLGGTGDETFTVTGGTGLIAAGNAGNDLILVRSGSNSTLLGGAGDDLVSIAGGSGIRVDGNDGANQAVVTAGTGIVVVGGGDRDTMAVLGGLGVTMLGGSGDDTITVGAGAIGAVLSGGDGNDRMIIGPTTSATLLGGTASETTVSPANGPADSVVLLGDAGLDLFIVSGGNGSTLLGGTGDDTMLITGGTGLIADAGDGNDLIAILTPAAGSTLVGGAGDDTFFLNGASGAVVGGGTGRDSITIIGTGGIAYGDGDTNTLSAGSATASTLLGGTADETIIPAGPATGAVLVGGPGGDALTAVSGDRNILIGGSANDTLVNIAADRTTLYGLGGDDLFDLRNGFDVTAVGDLSVYNFTGNDTFTISGGTRVAAYGEKGNDRLTVTGGTGVSLYGGSGSDTLTATGGSDVLLAGNSDNDLLIGSGAIPAQMFGGLGNDVLYTGGVAGDILVGEEGDDRYQLTSPTASGLTVTLDEVRKLGDDEPFRDSYGFGTDVIDLRTLLIGVTLDLSKVAGKVATDADRQTISGNLGLLLFGIFDSVYGTPFADRITGNDADNALYGFGGDDTLIGGAGNDTLVGGDGSNQLLGGAGSDVYQFTSAALGSDVITENSADPGTDVLDFSPLTLGAGRDLISTGVTVNLGLATAQLAGPSRSYTIVSGLGLEGAIGTRFNDILLGTGANDSLVGGDGNDSLVGGNGNDTLNGGAGDDTLVGGAGNDWYQLSPSGIERVIDTSGIDTVDFQYADYGVTVSLALDAGQIQTVDVAGNRVQLTGTFERLLGSSFDDVLTGNAVDNDIIGRNGLDSLVGGGGNDYLQGGFTQVVFLDFDSDTRDGEYVYSSAQRTDILTYLTNLYAPFAIEFTLDPAVAASRSAKLGGQYTIIRFNAGAAGGQSDQIDPRNINPTGVTQINAYDFIVRYLPESNTPATIDAAMTAVSGGIAAHELGHQLGLRHADAYGPIGTGAFSATAPTAGGAETVNHVMASPLSLGTPATTLLGSPNFGERESLLLAFTQYGSATAEPIAAHRSVATAAPLVLQPLIVPNTLRPGDTNYGAIGAPNTFTASAVAISGRIEIDPATGKSENDYYAFSGRAGTAYTFVLSSTTARRFAGNAIDGVLRLYDAAGRQIAMNDDDFESQDSLLLDVVLPADGTYYLVVDTFTDGITDTDTGRYELLVYRMGVGPETGRGDTLVGSTGQDTLVTGTGPDLVVIPTDASQNQVISGSGRTVVDATRLPSYNSTTQVTGPAIVIGVNRVPTFTAAPTRASVDEGARLQLQYTAVDPDGGSKVRYTLINAPAGATIDPVSGLLTWYPPDNGSYTFTVHAVDLVGANASVNLTVTVANVAPGATITGVPTTPLEGSAMTLAANVIDPSSIDQAAGFTYDWLVQSGNRTLLTATTPTLAFTPADDGTYSVRLRVTDKDRVTTTITRSIVVGNVAPSVTLSSSLASVSQGTAVTLTATATDPSSTDTTAGFIYTWTVNGVTVLTGRNRTQYSYTPRVVGTDTIAVSVADNLASGTSALQIPVLNVAPTIAGVTVSSNRVEGAPVTATVTFTDPGSVTLGGTETYTVRWTAIGTNGQTLSGTVPSNGGSAAFSFTPSDNGAYDLRVTVVENTPTAAQAGTVVPGVTVANLPPVASITGTSSGMLADLITFTLTANDPSPADQAAGFTFNIDWNGDGVIDQIVTGPSGTTVVHAFNGFGAYTVKVTATDKDGATSAVASTTLSIAPVSLISGVLTVFGGGGNDDIRIRKTSGNALEVLLNRDRYGPFVGVTSIAVYGGAGNDFITVDCDVAIPAQLAGEAGDDMLIGGAGNDVLDGGAGNDVLIAISGADLLRGGDGNDFLTGGSGRDTLAGGNGNDILWAGSGDDQLLGEAGDDLLRGGSGSDTLDGGTGFSDILLGGSGNDLITDPDGVLLVTGGSGNDRISVTFLAPPTGTTLPEATIDGGAGDDTIIVVSSNAKLALDIEADSGNDRIELSGVWLTTKIRGGSGTDVAKIRGTGLLDLYGIELFE